jgi:uncharacterized membrane protein YhaH (DUF805 family)
VLIFEAIFAFLRRSLGSVLRAMFGWATLALFGEVREKERPLLTLVVAAAAVWPLLLVGTIFPRPAALVLAVLPVPKGTPESIMRGVWIALTLLIPLGVGWALSRRNRDRKRSWWKSLLLGFPTTLGLGLAFLFVCVAVPVRKVSALAAGRKEEHVPLAIAPEDYTTTVAKLGEALARGGIAAAPRRPPWGTRVLGRLLHAFAGAVLKAYQPEDLAFLCTDEIEMTFYPNGVRLYGDEAITARAHSLLAEAAMTTPALLCMSPEGQKLEERIRVLWKRRHEQTARLDADVQSMARELAETPLGFLYRELLQVVVASRGASKLIESALGGGRDSGKNRVRRLRHAARRARSYGGETLRKAAADRSLKVIEKVADRMLRMFAGR